MIKNIYILMNKNYNLEGAMQPGNLVFSTLLILTLFIASSCGGKSNSSSSCLGISDSQNSSESGEWLSIRRINVLDSGVLQGLFPDFKSVITNDIFIYKLSYNSFDANQGSDVIQASGLLIVPKSACDNESNNPWVLLNHATIVDNASAPTQNAREGLLEAGLGFITLVPDYIGFGDSYSSDPNTRLPPYIIQSTYASDGYSMMKAAKSLLTDKNIGLGNLYIKGYSEGGYAALALQKFLETDSTASTEFTITASAPTAGPYSTVGMGFLLTGDLADTTISPTLFGFLATSYYYNFSAVNSAYTFSTIFNQTESYDAENLFNGQSSSTQTEAVYSGLGISTINGLMNSSLVSTLQTDTAALYAGFLNAGSDGGAAYATAVGGLTDPYSIYLNANDLLFTSLSPLYFPQVTTIFYHCTGDSTIYPVGTDSAVDTFKGFEALMAVSPSNVHKVTGYPEATHSSCPYALTPELCFLEIEGAIAAGGSFSSLGESSYCKN